jgi:hypothetical protein
VDHVGRLSDEQFNGYLSRRIPHELDDLVADVVMTYRGASPTRRREMIAGLDTHAAEVLSVYGERMAAVAVRARSAEALRRGIVAMGMAQARLDDRRTNAIVLAAVNHSATLIGTDLSSLLAETAAELPEQVLEAFRRFAGRADRDKSLQAMGLRTTGVADSFRYASG